MTLKVDSHHGIGWPIASAKITEDILPGNSHPIVFLVGAGISFDTPSLLPTAIPFIKEVLGRLTTTKIAETFYPSKPKSTDLSPPPAFEFVCQLINEYLDPELWLLERYASQHASESHGLATIKELDPKPNFAHLALADFLLYGHYVFTTNFDNLIEDALVTRDGNIGPNIPTIFSRTQYSQVRRSLRNHQPLQPGIYKLHGSLYEPRSAPPNRRPDTLGVTFDNIGMEKNKEEVFKWAIERGDLYVLGYSGSDQFDILPMMASARAPNRRLVWIIHLDNDKGIDVFGGRGNPPLSEFQPKKNGSDPVKSNENRRIKELLQNFINTRKRSKENVYLICGSTRSILLAIYLDVFKKCSFMEGYHEAENTKKERERIIDKEEEYFDRWTEKTIKPKPVESKLAVIEFMWQQNLEEKYGKACQDLRRAVLELDDLKKRRIATAIADKYEAWFHWFKGNYFKTKLFAKRAQLSLSRLRSEWIPLFKKKERMGELALEGIFDAYQCRIEASYLLGERAGFRKAVAEFEAFSKEFRINNCWPRVKKAWADIQTLRANAAYSNGNLLDGWKHYLVARNQYQRIGDRQWKAYAWGGVADFFRVAGCFDRAFKEYKKGYEPIRILGGTWFDAWYIMCMIDLQRHFPSWNLIRQWKQWKGVGEAYLDKEEYPAEKIPAAVTEFIKQIKASNDKQTLALAYRWRGDLLRQLGRFKSAQRDYERAKSIFREEKTPRGEYATALCEFALRLQQGKLSVRKVETFKQKCKNSRLQLEEAHCDLLLAEMERIKHGWSPRFKRCYKTYKGLNCYWGQLMSLIGEELGNRRSKGAISLTRSLKFAKDHKLKWARALIKNLESPTLVDFARRPVEFYFPLFN